MSAVQTVIVVGNLQSSRLLPNFQISQSIRQDGGELSITAILAFRKGEKMKLVDDAQLVWKKWSFKLHAAAACFIGPAVVAPQYLKDAWENLPDSIKSNFPPRTVVIIGFVLIVLGVFSMFIQQPKLDAERNALK